MRIINILDYKFHIERGLIDQIGKSAGHEPGGEACGEREQGRKPCGRCIIISDSNVYPLYGARIEKNFEDKISFVIEAGEDSKNLKTYEEVLRFLAENGVDKSDTIIALGGGVVGDLAGFAAATYMRGIRYVQVPTTLLAAVDSSVGGKTAVNLKQGKNLVGAIHQPEAVYFDPEVLETLDRRQLNSGMAEVIKYAVLSGDERLVEIIEALAAEGSEYKAELIEEMVEICVKIKGSYIEKDPLDEGERRMLNLGHTVGHALEKLSGYELLHGEAVAIGLTKVAEFCEMNDISKLKRLFEMYDLPTTAEYPMAEVNEQIRRDKKAAGGKITFVSPYAFGICKLEQMDIL